MLEAKDCINKFANVISGQFTDEELNEIEDDAGSFINDILLNDNMDWSNFKEFYEQLNAVDAMFFIKYFLSKVCDIDIDLSELDLDPKLQRQFTVTDQNYYPTIIFDNLNLTEGEKEFPFIDKMEIGIKSNTDSTEGNVIIEVTWDSGEVEYICNADDIENHTSETLPWNGLDLGFIYDPDLAAVFTKEDAIDIKIMLDSFYDDLEVNFISKD